MYFDANEGQINGDNIMPLFLFRFETTTTNSIKNLQHFLRHSHGL